MRFAALVFLGTGLVSPIPARAQDTVSESVSNFASDPPQQTGAGPTASQAAPEIRKELFVTAGRSLLVESLDPIERVAVGFGDLAEATAVTQREVLLNGKAPGQTSLIIWQRGGGKLLFDVTVQPSSFTATNRVETVNREIKRELPDQNVEMSYENGTVFLRGRVKNLVSAERAVSIAATLGPTVNLLYVDVPPAEQQILLKVRFATVDRSASLQLGLNLISTGAGNTVGGVSTQQFSGPQIANGTSGGPAITLSDALNIFLFRSDLNLAAAIQALQQDSLLEILAEPNVLAMNGRGASFLAGGEFPFPSFQPAANGVGTVTVQFREYGIRLNFLPTITPRGTIRLEVEPEVSALDFTNGLVVQGYTIPALTVRKVSTEIELRAGQSFAIAGLIDNQFTETIGKIPLLGDVPVLGKLFQSKSRLRNNTELLVIVTPELVTPTTSSEPAPEMNFPQPPQWPGAVSKEEVAPVHKKPSAVETIPFETLVNSLEPQTPANLRPAVAAPQKNAPAAASPRALPLN
jgi:pilus assembly protein CpaC